MPRILQSMAVAVRLSPGGAISMPHSKGVFPDLEL